LKKRVLITGCNGLIGSDLIEELKKQPDFNLMGVGRSNHSSIKTFRIDFSKDWSEKDLPEKMDVIIHLAQSENFRNFPESAEETFVVNTYSTLKLLDYARKAGVRKFIYASSGGIYGSSDQPFNEDSHLQPIKQLGMYLSTKICSEVLISNYNSFFEINVLRFFFVYGSRQNENMFIPRLVYNIRHGNKIILHGHDGIKINPIYVSDAVASIVKVMDVSGIPRFNIAGSEILSLRQICEIIGEKLGKKPIFEILDENPKNLIADISKMRKHLLEPRVNFTQGIQSIIEKYVNPI
jgi:nucleoside-diphosphate-sugar epimerase